jgi:hypothetical protein
MFFIYYTTWIELEYIMLNKTMSVTQKYCLIPFTFSYLIRKDIKTETRIEIIRG